MDKCYILIKGMGMLVGIFSSKEKMRFVIEELIKDNYQKNGCHGDYHFRYIEIPIDAPWFSNDGSYNKEVGKAIFSLSTMHIEYFPNKVETDWSTGEIIKL